MAEVFETLHHITREARDRLAAAGAMNVTGRSNECVIRTGFLEESVHCVTSHG